MSIFRCPWFCFMLANMPVTLVIVEEEKIPKRKSISALTRQGGVHQTFVLIPFSRSVALYTVAQWSQPYLKTSCQR